jgi:hypothetical protein
VASRLSPGAYAAGIRISSESGRAQVFNNAFNYVAAIASIVSLALAFTPYFPRHRKYIRFAAIFFAGMLVGSVCASLFAQTTIVFQLQLGMTQILLLGAAIVVAVIVIVVILWLAIGG